LHSFRKVKQQCRRDNSENYKGFLDISKDNLEMSNNKTKKWITEKRRTLKNDPDRYKDIQKLIKRENAIQRKSTYKINVWKLIL